MTDSSPTDIARDGFAYVAAMRRGLKGTQSVTDLCHDLGVITDGWTPNHTFHVLAFVAGALAAAIDDAAELAGTHPDDFLHDMILRVAGDE